MATGKGPLSARLKGCDKTEIEAGAKQQIFETL
jgi:hypothetical protein